MKKKSSLHYRLAILALKDFEKEISQPKYKPMPERIRAAEPPRDFFGLRIGEDRVQLQAVLGPDDLLIWHGRLHCTMHVHKSSIHPAKAVDDAIRFLKSIDK